MTYYYSCIPDSSVEAVTVEYHARWYGRILIHLSAWLHDLAYIGSKKVVRGPQAVWTTTDAIFATIPIFDPAVTVVGDSDDSQRGPTPT